MKLECYLIIKVPSLITENEIESLISELKDNNIYLNYYSSKHGINASADFLGSTAVLLLDSGVLSSIINSGIYDVFKHYIITIVKMVNGRKIYKLSSSGAEEKKATFSIDVRIKDQASVTYSFEGVVSETDIENSLDSFIKSLDKIQKSAKNQESTYDSFNTDTKEWIHKTIEERIEEIRNTKGI